MNPKLYQFLVALFASFGSFLYGYDLGIIASVVASDSFIEKFVNGRSHVAGTVVALFTAGAFFGAYGAGFTDPLGRRTTLALGSVLFIIGGVLQTAAVNHGMLYFSRIFSGFGIGILVEVVPMFQAEIAHARIRGVLGSLQQTMLGIGALSASWIGYGCEHRWSDTGNSVQWRLPYVFPSKQLLRLANDMRQPRTADRPCHRTRLVYFLLPRVSSLAD
jgi:MFS family permease